MPIDWRFSILETGNRKNSYSKSKIYLDDIDCIKMRTGKNFVYKVNKNLNNTVNQISDGKNVADNFLTASVLHCWSTLNDRKGEIERRNTMYPGLVLAWRKDTF